MKKWMGMVALILAVVLVGPQIMARAEDQPVFSAAELNKFLDDYPQFLKWLKQKGESPEKDPNQWAAYQFSQEVVSKLEKLGWAPERFSYLLSHVAAGLSLVQLANISPEMAAQLAAQKQAILASPLSEKDKKEALEQLEQAVAQTRDLGKQENQEIPKEELELIRKNFQRILDTMKSKD